MSAAACALGTQWTSQNIVLALLCAASASVLNAASNVLNQMADIDIDRINKPDRPLSSGRVNMDLAKKITIALYILSLSGFLAVDLIGGYYVFVLGLVTAGLTYIYSYGPRTKQHWLYANLTIGVARGFLLVLIGWSAVRGSGLQEALLIGSVWTLFLFGAAYTKDFSDIEGDLAHNCITLPIKLGVQKAARFIAPFLVLPFLLFNVYGYYHWLTGSHYVLHLLGGGLTVWGAYITYLILKDPKAMTRVENHPSWIHMYLLLIVGQTMQAIGYMV